MARSSILAAALLVTSTYAALPSAPIKRQEIQNPGVFESLTASSELNWVPCYENFTCTLLTVPLDYTDATPGETNIAFLKYTGPKSTGQEILYNPGGPGGSGVESLLSWATTFSATFGAEYDFVSFDPRGVGDSGTIGSCFPSLALRDAYTGSTGSTPLQEQFQSKKALGEYCTRTNQDTNVKYQGTSAVVQDMMHYTELSAKAKGEDPAEAKIWYYGVSYGTVIGHTLATMYPDRIGRIIVDGNVYSHEHYQGLVTNALDDTDDAFQFFFQYCYEARDLCPFNGQASSAREIEHRYKAILQSLTDSPPIIPLQTDVLTRAEFENWAFGKMYGPRSQFMDLAVGAAQFEAGNFSALYEVMISSSASSPEVQGVSMNPAYDGAAAGEALMLITGVDVAGRYPIKNFADYKAQVDLLRLNSFYGNTALGNANALLNNGLVLMPPKSQYFEGFKKTTTAVPMLFIGTTGDPITPLSSAFKMAAYFPGSKVITQKSPGHGFASAVSKCTHDIVKQYIADGTVPSQNTVCENDLKAGSYFHPPTVEKRRAIERRGRF